MIELAGTRSRENPTTIKALEAGSKLAMQNPLLLYQTMSKMLKEGKFNNDAIQKFFVTNFIKSAEKYPAPKFSIEPSYRNSSTIEPKLK